MSANGNWIMYDGECPFCSNFVKIMKLRESVGPVALINARDATPEREEVRRAGFDMDKGMAMKLGGALYYGKDCANRIALLSTPSGMFNVATAWLLRSPARARLAYPVMTAGRRAVLFFMGRKGIEGPAPD